MYTVERIEELDFGCEGRPEGMKDMVRVFLKGENGEEESLKVEDAWLYAHGIDASLYAKKDLKNPAVVVDANHSNSNKQYKEQIRIVTEVLHSRNYNPDLKKLVKGVMIESYLLEGRQDISDHMTPGCSITDPCLGWEDTERLIYDIAEKC